MATGTIGVNPSTVGPTGAQGATGATGPAGTTDHTLLTNIGTNAHTAIDTHLAGTANPHAVTKTQVGLGSADNTTDAAKPVSTAQQTALNLKANLAGPTFTGTVVLPANQTLTTPTIADLTNAGHAHTGATSGGTLNASAIAAGTVATARLGTGTADATTFLRGDQTYAVPAGGGGGAPTAATYIVQTADATLSAEQALGALATGILKNTTTTGVLSIAAAGTDYETAGTSSTHAALNAAHGAAGAVVGTTNTQTLTGKTLTAPTIADLTNAGHGHTTAATGGTLSAAAIASGTVATARLGTGTADATTFLRGDQTYAVPAGGSGTGDVVGPASSVDGGVALFSGTTGKIIKAVAGSATAGTWPKLPVGTLLTTPEAGAQELDGATLYNTPNTTNGRVAAADTVVFRLAANGAALGPTIADFFGATSAFPTVAGAVYQFVYYLWYLKTTAGTVTYTLTNTQAYTNLVGAWEQSNAIGLQGQSGAGTAGIGATAGTTTAAAAFPPTAGLTTAVTHWARVSALAEVNLAGDIRLRITSSLGTVTPLRGSYYTVRRLPAGNTGVFVA
ncbi:MAG: hypothetical protein H0U21_09425 [Acidimicrobiia bacterium]|nr:hypothetical protein [Acidimicrobiia bacterium]